MSKDVLVPPLGQTTAEVTLVHWYKHEGDAVQAGEPLYAIETDKAVLDIEAPASGVLRQVAAADGDKVAVLSAIAVIATGGEVGADPRVHPVAAEPSAAAVGAHGHAPLPMSSSTPSSVAQPTIEARDSSSAREHGGSPLRVAASPGPAKRFISPRARRLAEAEGLTWSSLAGSGPEGAIVARDVRAALERRVPVGVGMPLVTSVPVTLIAEADCTEILHAQAQLQRVGRTLSVGDLVMRVVAQAQVAHPEIDVCLVMTGVPSQAGKLATLGFGPIQTRPAALNGQLVLRQMAWLTLTCDAALGEEASDLLEELTQLIAQPLLLLA